MLLYIHFPFCRSKCIYCNFYSVKYKEELLDLYLKGIIKEIKFWKKSLSNRKFHSIYIGGGTPSILKIQQLEKILNEVFKSFTFEHGFEFTIEGNPESLKDLVFIKELRRFGINRISIGVQSVRDNYLKFLGRIHTSKDAIYAVKLCQLADFDNINIDLLWGLPSQTVMSWLQDLKQITELGITHLSCYGLTIEENTPLFELVKSKKVTLPEEKVLSSLYLNGSDLLESRGFIQYEISNFARLGFACRHNMGYWEQIDYLGVGPSAVSTIEGYRWENVKSITEYYEKVTKYNKVRLTEEDVLKEFIMLRLRTSRGLSLKEYSKRTGKNFWRQHHKIINVLHKNNLIRIRNGYLSLTKNGFLVSNAIIEKFFP